MLSGDLSTMALPDLLQWVDSNRSRACVRLQGPEGESLVLYIEERSLVAASPPLPRGKLPTDGTPDAPGEGLLATTEARLLDTFLRAEGSFSLQTGCERPEGLVDLNLATQFVLMEGMRLLDEWPKLSAAYPDDAARVAATDKESGALPAIQRLIHQESYDAPTLGEIRLVLGISRATLLRNVNELRERGYVEVEGTAHGPDLGGDLIRQAATLLKEQQYREAAHVFRSLLAANPEDERVRALLAETERRQIDELYRRLSPTDIVSRAKDLEDRRVEDTERAVYRELPRPRAVAVVVLMSPLRELETLRALASLADKGLLTVESAD